MLINLLALFILFILGACLGSFMNLWIYRLEKGEPWITGRSKCDHCGKQISWRDNIPLLSFFLLKRRSRCCKKPLSWKHPLVELSYGLLLASWFTLIGVEELWIMFIYLLIGLFLLAIFFADLFYMIIPDTFLVILALITVPYRIIQLVQNQMTISEFVLMIISTAILFCFFYSLFFFTKGKGFGFGDVKFSLVMGLILGWPKLLVGVFLAFIFGSIIGIILIALKLKKLKQVIPFGPFLVLGSFFALLYGEQIWFWYLDLLI